MFPPIQHWLLPVVTGPVLPPGQPGVDPQGECSPWRGIPSAGRSTPPSRAAAPYLTFRLGPGGLRPSVGLASGFTARGPGGPVGQRSGFLGSHLPERVPGWYRPGRAGEMSPQGCRPPAVTRGSAVAPSTVSGGHSVRRQFRSSLTFAGECGKTQVFKVQETRVRNPVFRDHDPEFTPSGGSCQPLFFARFRAGDRRRFRDPLGV